MKKCGLYEKINNIHLKFYRTKRGIVMIKISGMKLKLKDRDIKKAVMAELRIKEMSIKNIMIRRKSLDARKKTTYITYTPLMLSWPRETK